MKPYSGPMTQLEVNKSEETYNSVEEASNSSQSHEYTRNWGMSKGQIFQETEEKNYA